MLGTIINGAAVIAGGSIGILLKKGIKPSLEQSIQKALGIAVTVVGINGVVTNMITAGEGGKLSSSGELLLVVSLVIGMLFGEVLKIEDRMNGMSHVIEKRFHMEGFAMGFVDASTIFCVGAMAIIGALNDGLTGDSSVLLIKSSLDFTCAIVLAASLGIGVVFSFLPVVVYQGGITLLAGLLSGYLAGELLTQVCMVGYAIILCIGINFLATTKIKTANLLPAILVPIGYDLIMRAVHLIQGLH